MVPPSLSHLPATPVDGLSNVVCLGAERLRWCQQGKRQESVWYQLLRTERGWGVSASVIAPLTPHSHSTLLSEVLKPYPSAVIPH